MTAAELHAAVASILEPQAFDKSHQSLYFEARRLLIEPRITAAIRLVVDECVAICERRYTPHTGYGGYGDFNQGAISQAEADAEDIRALVATPSTETKGEA